MVFFAIGDKAAEIMIEGGVDHRIGSANCRQQRFGTVQRAGLHFSAGGRQAAALASDRARPMT